LAWRHRIAPGTEVCLAGRILRALSMAPTASRVDRSRASGNGRQKEICGSGSCESAVP
jgi:hypothetical protein